MGTALGSALAPALARFAPEAIIVGGKVGRSLPLFGPALTDALAAAGLPTVPVVQADGNLALWGAADSAAKLSAGNAHKLAARRGNKRCVMSSPATP
jgi:predicted NBD/HSP70 family sugar kinase